MTLRITTFAWLVLAALPLHAQEACDLHDGMILSDPVEVVLRVPADWENAAEADPATLAGMAPLDGQSGRAACEGDSLVGALNCVTEEMARAGGEGAGSPMVGETVPAAPAAPTQAEVDADPGAWIEARITMRGMIDATRPPVAVRFVPTGVRVRADRARMTQDAAARMQGALHAASAALSSVTTTLGFEDVVDLREGGGFSSLFLETAVADLADGPVAAFPRGALHLPEACGFLLHLRTASAAATAEMADLQGRIVRLRSAMERIDDPDQKAMFEREIARLTSERAAKAGPADLLAERVRAEETRQEALRHEAELAAIRADPRLTEAEEITRLGRAARAMRELRRFESRRAATLQAYRDGLAEFDAEIAAAPDDATREEIEARRARFQRLAQQFEDRSLRLMAGRHRDAAREFAANQADGIGPTGYGDVHARLTERGFDADGYIETTDEDLVRRAAEIARSDRATLGGTASRDDSAMQFLADTGEAFLEERNRLAFTPDGAMRALHDIASGERTLGQVLDDQATFLRRYAAYGEGVARGGVNGVVDLVELGWDGIELIQEAEQYYANQIIAGLGGPEDAINLVENDRTDSIANFFARGFVAADEAEEARRQAGLPRRTSFAEAWEDPAQMGSLLYDLGDRAGDAIGAGGGMVADAGDARLTVLSRHGERGVLTAVEGTGEVVGELTDFGVAALSAARGVRRVLRTTDAASPDEALRALDGPVDDVARTASDMAAAERQVPDGPATAPFDGVLRADGPTLFPDATNARRRTGAEDYVPDASLVNRPMLVPDGEIDAAREALRRAEAEAYGRQLWDDTSGDVALPDELTVEAPTSPFNADYRATDVDLRPRRAEVTAPDGTAVTPRRQEMQGTTLRVDGQTIELGEHLGSGTSSSAYTATDGNGVWRVTDSGTEEQLRAVGEELVGRNLLREAEARGARYFRPAARSGAPIRVQPDNAPPVFLTREEQVNSVASVYGPTGERLEPLDRLTLALAQREMNTHGIAYTDLKLENVGLVADAASPTGRRAVYFDTGSVLPMRGATAADRAQNARTLQRATDLPMPVDTSGVMRQYWRNQALSNGHLEDVVDLRPFGGRMEGGGVTPTGNTGRSEYLRLMDMGDDELAAAIQGSEALAQHAAREGLDLSLVTVPRP